MFARHLNYTTPPPLLCQVGWLALAHTQPGWIRSASTLTGARGRVFRFEITGCNASPNSDCPRPKFRFSVSDGIISMRSRL